MPPPLILDITSIKAISVVLGMLQAIREEMASEGAPTRDVSDAIDFCLMRQSQLRILGESCRGSRKKRPGENEPRIDAPRKLMTLKLPDGSMVGASLAAGPPGILTWRQELDATLTADRLNAANPGSVEVARYI